MLYMLTHLIHSQPLHRHHHFKEEATDAHRLRNSFKVAVSKWPSQRAHLAAWPQSASSYLLGSPASSGGTIGKCLPLGSPTDSRYVSFTEFSGACSSRNSLYLWEPSTCVNPDVTHKYEIQTTTLQEGVFLLSVARYLGDFVHKCL